MCNISININYSFVKIELQVNYLSSAHIGIAFYENRGIMLIIFYENYLYVSVFKVSTVYLSLDMVITIVKRTVCVCVNIGNCLTNAINTARYYSGIRYNYKLYTMVVLFHYLFLYNFI